MGRRRGGHHPVRGREGNLLNELGHRPSRVPSPPERSAAGPGWDDPGLVFAEPWQGRAYALAHGLTDGLTDGLSADGVRTELRQVLADVPGSLYFESVVHALERAVVTEGDQIGLRRARLHAGSYPVDDPEHGPIRVLSLRVDDGNRSWAAAMTGRELWSRARYLEAYWGESAAGLRLFDRHERLLRDVPVELERLHHLLDDVLFLPLAD
ncbi:MAG: hypothetical protein J7518_19625 [Nocardioidaceae bacterium]|nr:hypothetical protein [Nocardioidaceae bacterium]